MSVFAAHSTNQWGDWKQQDKGGVSQHYGKLPYSPPSYLPTSPSGFQPNVVPRFLPCLVLGCFFHTAGTWERPSRRGDLPVLRGGDLVGASAKAPVSPAVLSLEWAEFKGWSRHHRGCCCLCEIPEEAWAIDTSIMDCKPTEKESTL